MTNTNITQSEEALQAQCYQWFHNTFPALRGLLFHIPNGGLRSAREGGKFKAMGVVPGIPDLLLCVPIHSSNRSHGLFIEMKAQGGKLSPKQVIAHDRLTSAGYEIAVVNNLDSFQALIQHWVTLSQYKQPIA